MEVYFLTVSVSPAVPVSALEERREVLAVLSLRQSLTPQSSHTLTLTSLTSLTTQISLNGQQQSYNFSIKSFTNYLGISLPTEAQWLLRTYTTEHPGTDGLSKVSKRVYISH